MAFYVDPDRHLFPAVRRDAVFVDKTGLIRFTNSCIGTSRKRICMARPRQFGKSVAVAMLSAYYSCGWDSRALFQDLQIARELSFLAHLNRHHVILIDVKSFWVSSRNAGKGEQLVELLQEKILAELAQAFPEFPDLNPAVRSLKDAIQLLHRKDSRVRFLILVDEWDSVLRDSEMSLQLKEKYLSFLDGLFGADMEDCTDLVYLTGIIPISGYWEEVGKRPGLTSFEESSMVALGLSLSMGVSQSQKYQHYAKPGTCLWRKSGIGMRDIAWDPRGFCTARCLLRWR